MTSDALRAEHFEALLRRLGPDRELAGARYEQLRRRLIVVFTYRGCGNAEELVDQTMDRVARKLAEEGPGHESADLSPFVLAVAWNIARESFRRPHPESLSADADPPDPVASADGVETKEREQRCLDWCLDRLAQDERELLLTYFQDERGAKIKRRALLARELRISSTALRLRIWRLTGNLRLCAVACLEAR